MRDCGPNRGQSDLEIYNKIQVRGGKSLWVKKICDGWPVPLGGVAGPQSD